MNSGLHGFSSGTIWEWVTCKKQHQRDAACRHSQHLNIKKVCSAANSQKSLATTERDEWCRFWRELLVFQGLFLISPPWTATFLRWRGLRALVILVAVASRPINPWCGLPWQPGPWWRARLSAIREARPAWRRDLATPTKVRAVGFSSTWCVFSLAASGCSRPVWCWWKWKCAVVS